MLQGKKENNSFACLLGELILGVWKTNNKQQMTQPHSFPVIVQLPGPILEQALQTAPELKAPLIQYAKTNNLKLQIKIEDGKD
jgi:hypothetical protein